MHTKDEKGNRKPSEKNGKGEVELVGTTASGTKGGRHKDGMTVLEAEASRSVDQPAVGRVE